MIQQYIIYITYLTYFKLRSNGFKINDLKGMMFLPGYSY